MSVSDTKILQAYAFRQRLNSEESEMKKEQKKKLALRITSIFLAGLMVLGIVTGAVMSLLG